MANRPLDTGLLDRAITFSVNAHAGTERRGKGYPYIVHPVEAMAITATMTSDQELLAAAVLHDTIEDTCVTLEQIREQFGEKLFMLSGLETGASSGGSIQVKSNARMDPPLFGLSAFGEENQWRIGVEKKARKTDPPKDYRRVRRLLYLASKAMPGEDRREHE